MRLVIDSNRYIAAFIKSGVTRTILLSPQFIFYAPLEMLTEIENHRDEIILKAKIKPNKLPRVQKLLFSRIKFVNLDEFPEIVQNANEIMEKIDPNDADFLAIGMALNLDGVWTEDQHFLKQEELRVYSTRDLIEKLKYKMIYDDLQEDASFRKDYENVLQLFKFDEDADALGRDTLETMLTSTPSENIIENFLHKIREKMVIVVGNGPSAPAEINFLMESIVGELSSKVAYIAADGAASLLIEKGLNPVAVFTDLDGITPEIMEGLGNAGCFFVVHAHGDNLPQLELFKPQIKGLKWVIGTTQTRPKGKVINPGGFTDGDRILYFLSHLPPDFEILLVGMDFGPVVGRYSKPSFTRDIPATAFKAQKLEVAVNLLVQLLPTMPHAIFEMEDSYPFPSVHRLSAEEVAKHLADFTAPRAPPDPV
jgi:hypothetical protein